jgi:hypothetical protein
VKSPAGISAYQPGQPQGGEEKDAEEDLQRVLRRNVIIGEFTLAGQAAFGVYRFQSNGVAVLVRLAKRGVAAGKRGNDPILNVSLPGPLDALGPVTPRPEED